MMSDVWSAAICHTNILKPRHFPLTESSDGTFDWTADSSAVLIFSNRLGKTGFTNSF